MLVSKSNNLYIIITIIVIAIAISFYYWIVLKKICEHKVSF